MSIQVNERTGVFSLTTAHTLYQMKADSSGVLLHLYYGQKTDEDMSYLVRTADRGFSGNPYEMRNERTYSLDQLPQEYSGSGVGDYRLSAVQVTGANGSRSVDLRFAGVRTEKGRKALPGRRRLPPSFGTDGGTGRPGRRASGNGGAPDDPGMNGARGKDR